MPDHYTARSGGRDRIATESASQPAPFAPDACVLRHVAKASRAVVAAYDPALAPFGLTGHQYNLMTTLSEMGAMTVGALADQLGMDASGVPRAIRPLSDEGLIKVERGEDRRQRLLSLTALGRKRLDQATPAWTRVQTELLDKMGHSRWQSLMNDLRALRRAATAARKPGSTGK